MVELDLRSIMPFERHELIFQKWDALKPGETLKIINDHDPKPMCKKCATHLVCLGSFRRHVSGSDYGLNRSLQYIGHNSGNLSTL